ncbi:MAG: DUF2089 family protein [Anaerolineae bacterium]
MAHKLLTMCPNCGGELQITRLECTRCETVISARYAPCRFCSLPADSLQFVEHFMKYRGNLKEMERELGESYWTLRTRLGEVIRQMGYAEAEEGPPAAGRPTDGDAAKRRQILDRLEAKEIDATEAAQMLSSLSTGRSRA